MKKEIIIKNKDIKTKLLIKSGYIQSYLNSLIKKENKIFCIIDQKLKNKFSKLKKNKKINLIFIKGGEQIKTYKSYSMLCEKLLSKKIDRDSVLVAIGGGTIGDLCGFVAGTILRGVKFILIPTTLLSQVDSSIGGKNGINSKLGKNLVGTFYQPNEVVIDINILKSLPKREFFCGYAEIIKHAIIKDVEFFNWLDKNYLKIFNFQLNELETAISKSINIKLWYVKKDTNEKLTNQNSRAMLNFGHSFGHALEAYYRYSNKLNHGEAISIGMIMEAKISNYFGYLSKKELDKIINHFIKVKLKINDSKLKSNEILEHISNDKKNSNNNINIIFLKKIGKSFFKRNLNLIKIKKILKNI